jgi:hypothetical protein
MLLDARLTLQQPAYLKGFRRAPVRRAVTSTTRRTVERHESNLEAGQWSA